MPWDPKAPTNPKYRTAEHRREKAKWKREIERAGSVQCAQPECVMDERTIWAGHPWHLGHDDSGTVYIGPVHPACNLHHAAVKGNALSRGIATVPNRWPT